MPTTDEREQSPFELLQDDQRRVDELLARMAQVLDKVARKRLGFRAAPDPRPRVASELEPRCAPRI